MEDWIESLITFTKSASSSSSFKGSVSSIIVSYRSSTDESSIVIIKSKKNPASQVGRNKNIRKSNYLILSQIDCRNVVYTSTSGTLKTHRHRHNLTFFWLSCHKY